MCPSFNSFGSNPSVSQLVWDTDLVIPDGKAIESASGEVGIVGDVSVSGNLSSDGAVIAGGNIAVDGYTPKLVQTTGTFSYSGNANELIFIPVVPSPGVRCGGSATLTNLSAGASTIIKLYARCYSLCGKTADLFFASRESGSNINFENVLIPATTQYINGFYLECVNGKAEIGSIDITSATYTSKMLI